MHVVATAGHVDHGKSTLVRALTGQEPDRLAEERRRGLTIELGYCWTTLPAAGGPQDFVDVAFVDVPGHERFVPTMLAGVGPVPTVLLVVAADDGWMPQTAEHLAALDALDVRSGLLVVTRSDLTDPGPALRQAQSRLRGTSLAQAAALAVSARTGEGMDGLRATLAGLVASLPVPDPAADVRLWVDRAFSVVGAGTVVTATLPAGTVAVGDRLALDDNVEVRVRALQVLERPVRQATGVARVALALGGDAPPTLRRGSVLTTPDAFAWSSEVDVLVDVPVGERLPAEPVLHVGASSQTVRLRTLDDGSARLRLDRPLPLRVGDRVLLRDPGSRRVAGATVADPLPPRLSRRGSAARRGAALRGDGTRPDLAVELRRRRVVRAAVLRRLGVPVAEVDRLALRSGDWLLDRGLAADLTARLVQLVDEHDRASQLDPGVPVVAAARALRLPTPGLLQALLPSGLRLTEGRVRSVHDSTLPAELERALSQLARDLAEAPFAAPDAARLAELGLHPRAVAAADRAGRLLRVSDTVVLLAGADREAVRLLARLPQPFTTSQARTALDTSRRVVLPLLGLLDRRRVTHRLPDDRREVVQR